jgi:hypothetical protein
MTFVVALSRQMGAVDPDTGKSTMAWQTVVPAMPTLPPADLGPSAKAVIGVGVEQTVYRLSWCPFADELWDEDVDAADRHVKVGDRVTFRGRTYTLGMLRDDTCRPTGPYYTADLWEGV